MADDIKSQLSETMKKIVLTGVGTIFLTEEAVRNLLGELKLPKELWSGLLENANRQKQEFLSVFAKEVAGVLSHIDIPGEARKFLEGQKVRISLEISFDSKKKEPAEAESSDFAEPARADSVRPAKNRGSHRKK